MFVGYIKEPSSYVCLQGKKSSLDHVAVIVRRTKKNEKSRRGNPENAYLCVGVIAIVVVIRSSVFNFTDINNYIGFMHVQPVGIDDMLIITRRDNNCLFN
ncbi:unnamed protein product [Rotaria magnacalcarata]